MTEEILKDLYRIPVTLPNSPLKLLNSYVIKGGDRNIIIDTGFRRTECLETMREGISELGLDMGKTDILLTHLHADHTGLAPTLATPTSRVYISRKELPWMYADTREERWAQDNEKFIRCGFTREQVYDNLKFAVSRDMAAELEFQGYLPIDGGDVFKCGDYELRAVSTPGHTPEHMCFWVEDKKIMFTGDHVLFDITPNITLWNEVEDSLGDYLNSLREVDKYDVKLALPGHRGRGDFHNRIAALLAHHEARLEECLQVVKNNPDSSIYDITGKMTWKIRCNSWEDFPIGQKWFAVGECHSHLRHLEMLKKVKADYSEEIIRYRAL